MVITRVSSSLILVKKAISTIIPTIRIGLKIVITIKERFRTLAKYSRFMISPSLLAIVLVIYGLNKNIVGRRYGFLEPIDV